MPFPRAITSIPGKDCGFHVAGPYRFVLHSTEGATAYGAIAAFQDNDSWPHFLISDETGTVQVWQFMDLDVGARSLEHRPGTIETNLHSAVQIEIVGHAVSEPVASPVLLAGLRRLLEWCSFRTNAKLTSNVQWKPYPASGGDQNGIRLTDQQWAAYNGVCGHMHVPNQEHGDPGAINISALLEPPLEVSIEGVIVTDVPAYLEEGAVWVAVLPLAKHVPLTYRVEPPVVVFTYKRPVRDEHGQQVEEQFTAQTALNNHGGLVYAKVHDIPTLEVTYDHPQVRIHSLVTVETEAKT